MAKKVENNINVTVVRFNHFKGKQTSKKVELLGFATVNVNGVVITGIKFMEGKHGYFMSMPSEKSGEEYYNTVWLDLGSKEENAKGYDLILQAITSEYDG